MLSEIYQVEISLTLPPPLLNNRVSTKPKVKNGQPTHHIYSEMKSKHLICPYAGFL